MVFVLSLDLLVKFLFLYSLYSFRFTTSFHEIQPKCHQYESQALLQFKQGFNINKTASDYPLSYPKTASWNSSKDCCSWDGIKCHEHTYHVIHIDLSSSLLYGRMNANSSLFRLVHLRVLDLSDNDFNYSQIPSKIGELSQLKFLNLSLSLFSGEIPPQVSQLSKLLSLDLGTSAKDTLTNLTSLKKLSVFYSKSYGEFPVGVFHLPNLELLDLGYNPNLNGSLPDFQPNSLTQIFLDHTSFSGILPVSIGKLSSLIVLSIPYCNFFGYIPSSLGNLTQLMKINLENNKFRGDPSASLANLTKLRVLDVALNEFNIETFSWVGMLSSLNALDISSVNVGNDIPLSFANLTQLEFLSAKKCNIKGEIPSWIMNLANLAYLNLRSNFLHGKLELDTFLNLKKLVFLDLSFNKLSLLSRKNSSHLTNSGLQILQLEACNLVEIPTFIRYLTELEFLTLSNNNITSLPEWLWKKESLQTLGVSDNSLSGEISSSICNLKSLTQLDLSFNNLRGNIPSCLGNFSQLLKSLNLKGNKLSGLIPRTYLIGNSLQMIDLSNNNMQGELPRELVNNRRFEFFDVSYNNINDSFPFWLGDLPELKVLSLSNNEFHGDLRCFGNMTCTFSKLHIIDLSHNEFSGSFPTEMIQSWEAMKTTKTSQLQYESHSWSTNAGQYPTRTFTFYTFTMSNKGLARVYEKLQNFYSLIAIDISSNRISGEIPQLISELNGIVFLNLSNNMLIGSIPSSLGKLSNLEALDLSLNSLSGKIPQQLTQLTFLEFFNVSFNNLTGPIPQNNQFSTFKGDSFEGNQGLCGDQLLKKCIDHAGYSTSDDDDDDNLESFFELYWTVVLIGYGGGLIAGVALGSTCFPEVYGWLKRIF